jgi:hypothetical protein
MGEVLNQFAIRPKEGAEHGRCCAHHVIRALLRMASGRRRQNIYFGGPRVRRGRALSRGQTTARPARERSLPVRVTIAPPRTSAAYSTHASTTQTIRTGATISPACCTVAAASTYIRSSAMARTKSCVLVAARLQDGWDSSLVRLIRPTRYPQSHIRPGFGPEAWAKLIRLG